MSEYEDLYGDMLDMIEIITTSIEINSREEHFYRRSAEATSSEVAKGLFSEIADEVHKFVAMLSARREKLWIALRDLEEAARKDPAASKG